MFRVLFAYSLRSIRSLSILNFSSRSRTVRSVSYTHLDVYKRQGHSKYNVGICTAAAGDEHLGAVHDVGAVLLLNSHGLLCLSLIHIFTERARQALTLAQEAAASFGHSYIGSEHLLLGLLREGGGPAAKALTCLLYTSRCV